MNLLERDPYLQMLRDCLGEAARGHGQLVFLGGESGIGKTSVAQQFLAEARGAARAAIVSCDGLQMPGAFGALHDVAEALGPDVERLLAERAPRDEIFRAVLATLRNALEPIVLIGEDAHWSDEATLELVRYLGRRIGSTRTLMIVSYRDDVLGPYHPLRRVLGDLVSAPAVRRLQLPPLSVEAVTALAAGTGIDPQELHQRTAGNPFYVTEIIGGGGRDVPPTVRDAVLARATQLSPEARALLDVAAVVGVTVDPDLLAAVIGGPIEDAVDACLAVGILRTSHHEIEFRHGLARDTFLASMSSPRRRALHRRVLAAMEARPELAKDLAHLAHHAAEANDAEATLRYAVAAGRHAAAFRSHREAAAQYERALSFADTLPEGERIALLEARSEECYLTGDLDTAIAVRQAAISHSHATGDRLREGDNLRWLSRLCWFAGRTGDAHRHGRRALQVLETLPPGRELAMALSNLSQLHMLAADHAAAISCGERAIVLAAELGDEQIRAHALANVGTALLFRGEASGWGLLEESRDIATLAGYEDDAARAITNMAWGALQMGQLERAERCLDTGIDYAAERDLLAMELYQRATRALVWCHRGAFARALAEAETVAGLPAATDLTRMVALVCIGRVRMLAGESPGDALDTAHRLAATTGELQRLVLVQSARAEAAWLAGDMDLLRSEAADAFALARDSGDPWRAGEMALWLHRAGEPIVTSGLPEPFALEIGGDAAGAAAWWREHCAPIAAARARASSGAEADLRAAFAAFDAIGASADARRVTRLLREMGAGHIPRGPRPSTRSNSGSLTAREVEVLRCLAAGASNREIADRLYLSPKTVGHHVSSILGKLEAASRGEAVERAHALGLLQDREPAAPI